jgi:hypothetical protein
MSSAPGGSLQNDAVYADAARGVDTIRGLAEVLTAPSTLISQRLSTFLAPLISHSALVFLVADAAGAQREGAGRASFIDGVSFLALDELRRTLVPGHTRRGSIQTASGDVDAFQALSTNGALLVLAEPGGERMDAVVLQLWNIVALRVQELADTAAPDYLQLARATSSVRMEALTELADEYSTTLESVLAALRSSALDDRTARRTSASATTCARSCATATSMCSSWSPRSTDARCPARSRTERERLYAARSSPWSTATTSAVYVCSGTATGRIC